MKEQIQKVADDIPAYAVGFTGISMSLADISAIAQQVGVILGAIVVLLTLVHRIILIRKDLKK